ncbi:MAG: NADH dehydrogenase, partial [Sulfurovum sp. PC08-66]
SRTRLVELYNQIPHPKVVVVLGSCTSTGGVFKDMYNVENGIDHYIPGRAASPELIIDGIAQALKRLQKKSQKKDRGFKLELF